MSEYTYIATDSAFTDYLGRLKQRGTLTIAVDLEGEFNLHVYGERFCLLQIYDGHEQVAVDPQTTSIDLIKSLLENRNLLKITYDCLSDRALLFKAHGITMNSILDLRPAVEILDFEKQDLQSVLSASLGQSESGNKKRFQQYNWTRRPIEDAAIAYAMKDVLHLFELKDRLLADLVRTSKLEVYILENLKRQDRLPPIDRQPGVFRSGRHRALKPDQQQRFRHLYDVRERYARTLDLPPNTVVSNNDLFALAAGTITLDQVRGNRRVPNQTLEDLKKEFA
jgi:ribonuclease D